MRVVFFIFLILASALSAQVTVEVDHFAVEQGPSDGVLGIPRQHVLAGDAGQVIVFVAGWRGRNLFLSTNLDAPGVWSDTMSLTSQPAIGNAGNHTHFSIDRDTIIAALPIAGGDSMLVKVVGISGNSLSYERYSYSPGYRIGNSLLVYRGGAWYIPNTDSLVLITRGHDGNGNDLMDIMSFVSPDRGQSWSDSIRVADFIDVPDQTRIGGFNYFDNTVTALVWSSVEDGVSWHNWDRTARTWVRESENPLTGDFARGYSGNVINDTTQFVVCANTGTESRDTLKYAYKNKGENSWHRGAFEMGTISGPRWLHANLCYVENSQRMVLFYQQYYAAAEDSVSLYGRYWQHGPMTWSDPFLVSTGRGIVDVSPTLRVPAAHGDVAYVAYVTHDLVSGDESVELARVRFDQPVETCDACIGSVGNIDCSESEIADVADLTELIDHLFVNFWPLCCPAESNINGDAGDVIDVNDLTDLIDHLFIDFPPLRACD